MEVIRYSLAGAQDIKWGTDTFEVVLADGRVVILEAVNASHIPGDTVNETVDDTMTDVSRARRGMTGLFDFDQDDATTTGLTWGYTQGMNGDGTGIEAAGTVTLTANSTNYVEWDPETGAISVNTSAFSPTDKVPIRKLVTNASGITTNTDVRPIWRQNTNLVNGQCYLSWVSTSSITLLPLNGNVLLINGTAQTVPAAGVSLSNSGLTISTTYNIYAYMNSGTMTLEASVTGHSASSTTGTEIKTGDATRAFVGEVDVDGSGNFEADVRNWFVPSATLDARTNAVTRPHTVEAPTSGTPAAGIGTGILFRAESADEAPSSVGALDFAFSDVTAGSEDSAASIMLRVAGRDLDEKYRFSSTAGAGFAALFAHAVTADRTFTMPDATGTVGLHSGVTSLKFVRKTSTETVNGSDVLQNDDELLMAMAANEVVAFVGVLFYASGATPDFKAAFTIPSGTIIWGWAGNSIASTADALAYSTVSAASGSALAIGGSGGTASAMIVGLAANGATPGNLQLQWAQNTSNASNTQVVAGSWLACLHV